ncbi:MAG: S9 family peptidase [Actinomycetota bacterium]|nr:S9 family peptidase [Actinomycetota bacterium]
MTTTAADPVPLVPPQVLFGNPERISPRISADGRRLAWIAPDEGVLNVWVTPITAFGHAAGESWQARPVTKDRDRGIRSYFWAHDNRHLLYVQDKGGDENWRLYSVDLETDEIRDLTPFEEVQARVEEVDKHFPNEILVGLNRDNPELHDLYHLDLRSGELEKVVENPGFVGFVVDAQFQARGALAPLPDGGVVIMVRDSVEDEWRPLLQVGQEDSLATYPVSFTLDGKALWTVTSVGANAGRLVRLDCGNGAMEVVAEDPQYDIAGARLHPDTREPQLVVFLRERAEYQVLDPSIADDIATLQALEPGDLTLLGEDDADRTWLAGYTNDDGPVRYYAYDRETKAASFLFEHQPALSAYPLTKMEPFSFTARDGLEIHGYLTFPPGANRTRLPAVLNVHGGPWVRDSWGYDAEAQWLANRGYLCIQVNYRGSTGYGKAFVNAGDRQWGAAMHDDLIDAVKWVVDQGYADKDRIAIYGGSYGGYAALVGAAFTPDVFRCAVDIVGPSNINTLIRSIPPYWAPMVAQFHTRVGNPDTEEDFLWSRSPLSRVDDIRIPILVAQGANDPRVKQAEAEQIVAALREKGIDHEYLLFPDEGHGFAKPENRLRFYAAAERFLAKHLGGRYEPEVDEADEPKPA